MLESYVRVNKIVSDSTSKNENAMQIQIYNAIILTVYGDKNEKNALEQKENPLFLHSNSVIHNGIWE